MTNTVLFICDFFCYVRDFTGFLFVRRFPVRTYEIAASGFIESRVGWGHGESNHLLSHINGSIIS